MNARLKQLNTEIERTRIATMRILDKLQAETTDHKTKNEIIR